MSHETKIGPCDNTECYWYRTFTVIEEDGRKYLSIDRKDLLDRDEGEGEPLFMRLHNICHSCEYFRTFDFYSMATPEWLSRFKPWTKRRQWWSQYGIIVQVLLVFGLVIGCLIIANVILPDRFRSDKCSILKECSQNYEQKTNAK